MRKSNSQRPDTPWVAYIKQHQRHLKEYPELSQQYFYGKPYFWTGAYFVATCGGVMLEQLKAYVEQQSTPDV
jgi:REP element-mobilizing transposase RayT